LRPYILIFFPHHALGASLKSALVQIEAALERHYDSEDEDISVAIQDAESASRAIQYLTV
jgi:hypothetical protein